MREMETSRFGLVQYTDAGKIEFPNGLPGFESEREFVLIERPESRPFLFLQSVDSPALCFVTVPISLIVPDYKLGLATGDTLLLQSAGSVGLDVLAIVCAMEDQPATVNLLGPVVINRSARRGLQTIRDDDRYLARHPISKRESEGQPC
jgi:flagellar assembly factor FliW